MTKLSLNKASKEAGVAKSTLLEALNSKRMSAEKNDKGHWEIDPSELFRVFPKSSSTEQEKPIPTPQGNYSGTSALQVEVKMLREQIDQKDVSHAREREILSEQIEALRKVNEEQRADFRQTLATITDQRTKAPETERKGFWARLVG